MRHSTLIAIAIPLSAALSACGRPTHAVAANDVDLQRDLKLAATTTMNMPAAPVNPANFDALETNPRSAPQQSKHLVKAPGPKAVASKAPDLEASPIPQGAAAQPAPQAQNVALAPVPNLNQDPVASLPRAGASQAPGLIGAGDRGRTGSGGGVFGGIGPILGAVIRGGDVDGDHCEPHGGRGRNGRMPGVYIPEPGGVGGGSRFPIIRPGGSIYR
ncbi:MAG TPA: hypothetical protein VMV51_10595 [Gemmatimonadaceae bacterium]|nr:hypothetical protein [Gemmatimonadaceae bacterium]